HSLPDCSGAPPGYHRHCDTSFEQAPYAESIVHMKRLVLMPVVAYVQATICEHPVTVEDRQSYGSCAFKQGWWYRLHTTPARKRSCMFSAPMSVPSPSVTRSPLIRCVSINLSASAASRPVSMVRGLRLITSSMVALRKSTPRSSALRRSPSVKMPRMVSS